MDIVVDSNVILDIVTEDKRWFQWSSEALAHYSVNRVRSILLAFFFSSIILLTLKFESVPDYLVTYVGNIRSTGNITTPLRSLR